MMSRALLMICLLVLLCGCQTRREVFAAHSADEVWTAMVAVARTPDYSSGEYSGRWIVRENHVWTDDEAGRIEVERRVERTLYRPAADPMLEERQWKISLELETRDPPTVAFTARNVGVPAHAWDEADRYFAEVREVLQVSPDAVPQPPAREDTAPREPRRESLPPMDEPR